MVGKVYEFGPQGPLVVQELRSHCAKLVLMERR
jgi:hypothetical protein